MPKMSPSYLGPDGQSGCDKDASGNCTDDPKELTIKDAVANVPSTNNIDWSNVYGVVVLFADTRSGGFYRGWTPGTGTHTVSPPSLSKSIEVFASVVGEIPEWAQRSIT
jgi:hypothetical protein